MPEIDEDVKVVFNAYNLSMETDVSKSNILIHGIQLSEDQAATLGYLINNPRNLLEAEIRLTGRETI